MADAAVEFLMENLKQVLLYYGDLIKNVTSEVETLENDLRLFRAFLKDSTKGISKDEGAKEMVRQIRDIVYEIEDAIDAYVTEAGDKKTRGYFLKIFDAPKKLINVAERVKGIGVKVQRILDRQKQVDLIAGDPHSPHESTKVDQIQAPPVKERNIVGFEDETEKLVGYLKEEKDTLDVISIIGLPGLGKTTIASKIFNSPDLKYEFLTRIWVNVSQDFKRKDVFLALLSKFTQITNDLRDKSDTEIAKLLQEQLRKGRFLIVMDDVWTADAWINLEEAFPKDHRMGKILITSRNEEVAHQANRLRDPHKLRFLSTTECWELLQLEVFGKPECPRELEKYGILIANGCRGLPLAVVVIGGILVRKYMAGDLSAMERTWKKVSENVSTHLREDHKVDNVISWSYYKLPFYLRPCFLYFGIFPEDFEIPVWKLTRMWIAEGFIPPKSDSTLEETAKEYLVELIRRNLIMVAKLSTDGSVKTCRIHDTLHQFCQTESSTEGENFFQEIKESSDGGFYPPPKQLEKYRRLSIHSNIINFVSMQPYGPRVRSFLCNSKEEKANVMPTEHVSSIPGAFKLLRILDAKPIAFHRFPRDLTKLVHLRYVVLSSNFKIVPDSIENLWNLQTLVVYTTNRTLEIRANIWKMMQLRHVKTNAAAILPKTSKSKEIGEKLQSVGTISPQSCTEDVFDRLRSLRKLGIRGLLVSMLDAKGMDKLEKLEKLKLVNDLYGGSSADGKLPRLPQSYRFPPNLKTLTLFGTFLDWKHMNTLGMLDSLTVLKLRENAFAGRDWEASAGGFRRLEVLHIERTDLVVWTAEANHFPRLKSLVLRNCESLAQVPYRLHEIKSFHKLELKRVTKSAAGSARRIEVAKKKEEAQQSNVSDRTKFKLYIAPGDE